MAVSRFAGWLWDQIPTHHQVKAPVRVFWWFERQANRRDERMS
jgi:hypothetical protein